ncbi:protein BCCIP homolog [Lepeophtheirus salmonis]|uniref:BCCIP homolog n=1 Tax=Lepeophtheirus salmonis TaxID=72036 RepID=C1BT25_LEPSM|nr:protein BCCIP homolog [Lepeophtheirus salmonis]ACO12178.1 BCCIP homolog [Lepeophtheirus salmonis]ADD24052.1 Protein BCCIP homolog [Lepeophtheirus salmonis]
MSRMPSSFKKAHLALETPENTESSSSSEDEDEILDEDERGELQVEFEARTAEDCDYHGISRLLRQTFKGEDIPLDALTNYLIAQKTVGSVITQSSSGNDGDDDDDEFDDLQNEVFGLISLIRLQDPSSGASKTASDYIKSLALSSPPQSLHSILSGTDSSIKPALLLSERIVNIPAQISVPLYETLHKEIKKATLKRLPFEFTHYLLLSKVLVSDREETFVNAEEEVFIPECDFVLDVKEKEPTYRQDWSGKAQLLEKRKLLVFRSSQFEKIVKRIVEAFPIPQ